MVISFLRKQIEFFFSASLMTITCIPGIPPAKTLLWPTARPPARIQISSVHLPVPLKRSMSGS